MEDMFLVSVEFQDDNVEWHCPPLLVDQRVDGQVGIYATSGTAIVKQEDHEETLSLSVGEIMVLSTGTESFTESGMTIRGSKDCKVVLLGGYAYPEKRHLLWNFCSWDTNKLKDAADAWERLDPNKLKDAADAWERLDRNKFPPVFNESNDDSIPLRKRNEKS